jgi:hypothetical protein
MCSYAHACLAAAAGDWEVSDMQPQLKQAVRQLLSQAPASVALEALIR